MREILDGVYYEPEEEAEFEYMMSNWVDLHTFTRRETDEKRILKMIKYEIDTKCRLDIIARLKSRYNAIKRDRENAEIRSYIRHRLDTEPFQNEHLYPKRRAYRKKIVRKNKKTRGNSV